MIKAIPTSVINLPSRTDSKTHIEKELYNQDEFDVHLEPAIRHDVGLIGLLETMKKIIYNASEVEYVLICQDNHNSMRIPIGSISN